jgi:hypothetical protein
MESPLQPDVRNEASNEILHQYLSAEKARRELGWSPLFSLDDALSSTVRWYEAFFATTDPRTLDHALAGATNHSGRRGVRMGAE